MEEARSAPRVNKRKKVAWHKHLKAFKKREAKRKAAGKS
jgi:hypothetical protein